jgi:hypothetical protein
MLHADDLEPARKDLALFVDWILEFLDKLKDLESGDGLLFDPPLRGQIRDAWPAFRRDFSDSGWRFTVLNAEAAQLQAHGLYGPQLLLKFWLVRYLLERFLLSLPEAYRQQLSVDMAWGGTSLQGAVDAAETVHRQPYGAAGQVGAAEKPKGLLKKLIEAIDVPLDSLIAALGLDGSVTEIKKVFGLSIAD